MSSTSIDSDSEWEDSSRERQLMALLQEKDRSISDLLTIARNQEAGIRDREAGLTQARQREQTLRDRVQRLEEEKRATQQKYAPYERYAISLNRPLKYVKNTYFATKTWLLTPEQRFGLANLVMPEAGGLLTIEKIQK